MAAATFLNLVGANTAGTVLNNLQTASAALKSTLNDTLNSALKSQLSATLTQAKLPVIAGLVEHMPPADVAAVNALSLQAFAKQQLDPMVANDPAMKQAVDSELAQLSDTTTVGGLLQLNKPLRDHPVFKADLLKADIASLLATSPTLGKNQQLQAGFIDRYAASTGTIEDFWNQLGNDPEFKAAVPELQFTLQLGTLTLNNAPLVAAIRKQYTPKSTRDLTGLTADDWTKLITGNNIAIPDSISGNTAADKAANYASAILGALQSAFPTDYIAHAIAVAPRDKIDGDVAQFLKNAPRFNLIRTNLPQYVNNNPNALSSLSQEDRNAFLTRISGYQRLARIHSNPQVVSALMSNGLDSAYKISSLPRAAFLSQYSQLLGGGDKAQAVYSSAQRITASALSFYTSVRQGLSNAHPWVFGEVSTQVSAAVQQIPNWETLFGPTSTCACQECRSVVGAAAYFVDLLQFLAKAHIDPNHPNSNTLLAILAGRRPDLVGLKLNCENTNTTLPYLDLVNEILESVVATHIGDPPRPPPHDTPPDATSDQLSVNPEFTNDAAYILLSNAFYPFSLPYDRFLSTARAYLEFTGSSLTEVMKSFQTGLDPANPASDNPNRIPSDDTIALEYLKISPNEFLILTGQPFQDTSPLTNPSDLAKYYGERAMFGTTIPITATGAVRRNNLVTITTTAPHNYSSNEKITISQVSDSSFDGTFLIVQVPSTTTFTYNQTGPGTTAGGGTVTTVGNVQTIAASPQGARRQSNVVTIMTSAAHHFAVNELVMISGVADKSFDGTFIVRSVPSANSFTYHQLGADALSGGGTATADWYTDIASASNFLQHTGISFQGLIALLETHFLNPLQSIRLQTDPEDLCDVKSTVIANLSPADDLGNVDFAPLRKFYRFIRLYRKLGWSISDLDKTIRALQTSFIDAIHQITDINASFLLKVSQLKKVQDLLHLKVEEALALWADIDIEGPDSLYISLFQNKGTLYPLDPAFTLRYTAVLPATTTFNFSLLTPYAAQISYARNGQLRFSGNNAKQLTANQERFLLSLSNDPDYQQAIMQLFLTSNPPFSVPLASLPSGLANLPAQLPDAIYSQGNRLFVIGQMPDELRTQLKTLSADPDYQLAIDNLYNQRWAFGTEIAIATQTLTSQSGQLIPAQMIPGHATAILAALRISASDLSAIIAYLWSQSAPPAATASASSTGGSLASGTYYIKVSAVDQFGEWLYSNESSASVSGPNGSIAVSWRAVPGATSYNVYYTVADGASGSESLKLTPNPPGATSAAITTTANGGAVSTGTPPSRLAFPLNIANISAVYRYATLSRALGISVPDLLSLIQLNGIDPFQRQPSNPGATVAFVNEAQEVIQSRFSVAQLNYIYRNVANPSAGLGPQQSDLDQFVSSLQASLSMPPARTGSASDPTGGLLELYLGKVLEPADVSQAKELIEGTSLYNAQLAKLPPISFPSAFSLIAFDPANHRLVFTGPMSPTQETLLLGLSRDGGYTAAIRTLFQNSSPAWNAVYTSPASANPLPVVTFPPALAGLIAYSNGDKQLTFTGPMSADQLSQLSSLSTDPNYQIAINSLFAQSAPAWQTGYSAPLNALPSVSFPASFSRISFDQANGRLVFTGPMSQQQENLLLGLSNIGPYPAAIQNLFQNSTPAWNKVYTSPASANPLPVVIFPPALAGLIAYSNSNTQLTFTGPMSADQLNQLSNLSNDQNYQNAISSLFAQSAPAWTTPLTQSLTQLPPISFPNSAPNSLASRLQLAGGNLQVKGALSDADAAVLLSLSADPQYQAAIESLYLQPRQFIVSKLFFLDTKQLINRLINGVATSTVDKYGFLLDALLTAMSSVVQAVSSSLKLDLVITRLLLVGGQTSSVPALLSSTIHAKLAAIADFFALAGNGLTGSYFSSPNFGGGAPQSATIEPAVDFNWSPASPPAPGLDPDTFSGKWTGQILAPLSGTYSFSIRVVPSPADALPLANPPVALRVGGNRVGNQVTLVPVKSTTSGGTAPSSVPTALEYTGTSDLVAGKLTPIELDYPNAAGFTLTGSRLSWSSLSTAKSVIPQHQLFADASFTFDGPLATYKLLSRIALLINTFKATAEDLAYLSSNKDGFAGVNPADTTQTIPFDLNRLPPNPLAYSPALLNQWERLLALFQLRDSLPGGDPGLLSIFKVAADTTQPMSAVADAIVAATGWNATDLSILLGSQPDPLSPTNIGFGLATADFTDERWLVRLQSCFSTIARFGVLSTQLFEWASLGSMPAGTVTVIGTTVNWVSGANFNTTWKNATIYINSVPFTVQSVGNPTTLTLSTGTAQRTPVPYYVTGFTSSYEPTIARDIQAAVKARYNDATWVKVGKSLNDKLRESSRDALVAYILAPPPKWELAVDSITTPDQLYEYFLIDVEMDACMLTSRIVQATAAVQLFVQRCLMNLEEGISPASIDTTVWSWMKNYRVWQANREVFLYPENWIDPSLRDDKTPFFIDLEKELQQSEITSETIERAFQNYLEKLHEVARLEICSIFWQFDSALPILPDGTPDASNDVLHVFARTFSTPHIYFHRRLLKASDYGTQASRSRWAPWQRVDLDIQGNHLIPVVWNRSLRLFWPIFSSSSDPNNPGSSGAPPNKMLTVKLAWSDYKQNKWSAKQVSLDGLIPFFGISGTGAAPTNVAYYRMSQDVTSLMPGWTIPARDVDVRWLTFQPSQVNDTLSIHMYIDTWTLNDPQNNTFPQIYGPDSPNSGNTGPSNPQFGDDGITPKLPQTSVWPEGAFNFTSCGGKLNLSGNSVNPPIPYTALPASLHATFSYKDFPYATIANVVIPPNSVFEYMWLRQITPSSGTFPLVWIGQANPISVLGASPAPYRLAIDQGFSSAQFPDPPGFFIPSSIVSFPSYFQPFFYQDDDKVYFADVRSVRLNLVAATPAYSSNQLTSVTGAAESTLSAAANPSLLLKTSAASDVLGPEPIPTSRTSPLSESAHTRLMGATTTTVLTGLRVPRIQFSTHFHSHLCAFIQAITQYGVPGLLSLDMQRLPGGDSPAPAFQAYAPDPSYVIQPYPTEHVDFSPLGAYSTYNWELFFHIPLLIATKLSQNQKFEEAQKWFHYIFNPTTNSADPVPQRFWNFLPFYECSGSGELKGSIDQLLSQLDRLLIFSLSPLAGPVGTAVVIDGVNFGKAQGSSSVNFNGTAAVVTGWSNTEIAVVVPSAATSGNVVVTVNGISSNGVPFTIGSQVIDAQPSACGESVEQQVSAWTGDPFNPFLIARMRTIAFRKTVVMKYLDNLIAWGDYLFRQNTRESINEATQIYVLAQQILGDRPVTIPSQGTIPDYSYTELLNQGIDDFSNVLVTLESTFPFSAGAPISGTGDAGTGSLNGVAAHSFYFCIPPDDQLLGYWTTVADRLYKIRHCMNIQGQVEQLALFAPPISPALLVQAAAAGVDLSSVLNDINAPTPNYRFSFTLQKALELCAEVRSLGASLLSALEKSDAEALSLLRSTQEIGLLQAVLQIKQSQIDEASKNLDGLQASHAVTLARQAYYQQLVNTGLSSFEQTHLSELAQAQVFQEIAQGFEVASGIAALLPNETIGISGPAATPVVTATVGGVDYSAALAAASRVLSMIAMLHSYHANRASITGGWDRRSQEWGFQLQTATLDLTQIQSQIDAASLRVQIANEDLQNQQLQITNAQAVLDFLRSKYTNQELYGWMISQISATYFQCYQMAYGLAKRAEACLRFELGLASSNFIQFGYWDNLRKGLQAGEGLYADLKRMEIAYLDQNQRKYEITKYVSLVVFDPLALITLKETGQCIVSLPEALFDMDYPGHYLRQIVSVTLTIPCVTGPYTSVNCRLTLVSSKIRVDNIASSPEDYIQDSHFIANFAATQSIATSSAQNDGGLFEVNFRDERYLPFEGAGAVSQWLIELPQDCNAVDFETISDVVMNLRYTARDGGAALRSVAKQAAVLPGPASQMVTDGSAVAFPNQNNLVRFFSLRHEFPTEWYKFLNPLAADLAQTMLLALGTERFPFQYRGKKISVSQVDLLLKFKDTHDPLKFKTGTPIGDFVSGKGAPGLLNVYVTQAAVSFGQQPSAPTQPPPLAKPVVLQSTPGNFDGMPYGSLASPLNLGAWWLQIFTTANYIGTVAPTLVDSNNHVIPSIIDDVFLVCHYAVS